MAGHRLVLCRTSTRSGPVPDVDESRPVTTSNASGQYSYGSLSTGYADCMFQIGGQRANGEDGSDLSSPRIVFAYPYGKDLKRPRLDQK